MIEQATVGMFVLRAGDAEAGYHRVPLRLDHDNYVAGIREVARFSGSAKDAVTYISATPHFAARNGLSSIWIDRTGIVHVIPPHHHNLAAFFALAENCEPEFRIVGKSLARSRITFRDLTLSSGIIRAQYYSAPGRDGGVGISILTEVLLSRWQIDAILSLYETTSKKAFFAEIYAQGQLIERITDPQQIWTFVEGSESFGHGAARE